jgi:selenocysteine-specific elongation factor
MRVIGTAGHVDHGKSTLIAALTGVHPDRLKEERAREMTIDLGFGWLTLPDGETVGVIDVPGHRDFIENMLAGVGGIDAALFVVAADEGVMPQTREHLAILDLLQIQGGVVALTKIDLVDDNEWLDLVESDVRQALHGTVLDGAPIVRVSARTRQGLDQLLEELARVLEGRPARADHGRPRLPVDRVFTMAGFGTVVTGTLSDGLFKMGDEVEILPQGLRVRIRGLQTHGQKEDVAVQGSRTAINLTGVNVDQIQRGNVISLPGKYQPTRWLDVRFRLLPDVTASLRHNSEVKLFIGACEVVARVRLLGGEEIHPGDSGWIQLELREPVVALRGDRFILRRPSPGETIGGGEVVDAHPKNRHKRFDPRVLTGLDALLQGTPAEVILQSSLVLGPATVRELIERAKLSPEQATPAIEELLAAQDLVALNNGEASFQSDVLLMPASQWELEAEKAVRAVKAYHQTYPLRRGMPREELKSRLKMPSRTFTAFLVKLVSAGMLADSGPAVCIPGWVVRLSAQQEERVRALLDAYARARFSPPSIKDSQQAVGEDVYQALVDTGRLVPVSNEVAFRKEDYDLLLAEVRNWLKQKDTLTVAEFRDRYDTSRRYALAFLEHLDAIGVTQRDGDLRRLRK